MRSTHPVMWLVVASLAACGRGSPPSSPDAAPPPPPPASGVEAAWQVAAGDAWTWDVVRKKAVRQGAYTEVDTLEVALRGTGPGQVKIEFGSLRAAFALAPQGTVTPDDQSLLPVPQILLALAGPAGKRLVVGDTVVTRFPADAALAALDATVVIQREHTLTVRRIDVVGADQRVVFDVVGKQRLLDNAGMRGLIGERGEAPTAAEDALARLASWQHYLTGEATWSSARRAVMSAAFVLAAAPSVRVDAAAVTASEYRNELTYTLR